MSISGVGQSYYQNNVAATKSAKNVNGTEKFALEKTNGTKELSEAEEMAIFKKEFYADLEKLGVDRTISNVAINISEEAFKNMKADPEYREKVLAVIKRDLSASVAPAPNCSLLITVGATLKDYRADAWSVNNDAEFYARSQNSFYKKANDNAKKAKNTSERDDLAEYYEKQRRERELRDKEYYQHKAMTEYWNRRQSAAASYEASILTADSK